MAKIFGEQISRDVFASRPTTGLTEGALFFASDTGTGYRWNGATWDAITVSDISLITGLGAGVEVFLATPSSANLKAALTDETGSGAAVFANSPTLVTPALGTPASGTLTNCTGLPESGVTNLTSDLSALTSSIAAKAPASRNIATTAPLTGGGDLSADRTLAISDFVGDSGAGGVKGAVPAPAAGDAAAGKYLKADGTFAVPPGTSGTVPSFADNETPSGTVNSSNTAFTLAHTPNPAASLQVFLSGVLQVAGTDYTLATATITFSAAPETGATLTAFYRY